ncbi:MAG: MBL fold metallo-hydrolase [Sphingobacteriaceae bacterium]
MKFEIFTCLFISLISLNAFAQEQTSDKIETSNGALTIHPIEHATFVMNWNGKTIYVDPTGGSTAFKNQKKPDLILVTDVHGDHFDIETLEAVNTATTKLIAPQAVADKLPESLKENLIIMKNSNKKELFKISITAIPMYNLPISEVELHTKGRGNGYLLRMGGKRIYISGDTEDIPEMRKLDDIDVAFVCMNLPYTMDVKQAADAVLDFKPRIVYPYHYRGQGGLSDVGKFKSLVNSSNKKIDVRLLKWY